MRRLKLPQSGHNRDLPQTGLHVPYGNGSNEGAQMLGTVIVRVVRTCCRFPWFVLGVAVIAAAGAAAYVQENFAITTDTSQLISATLPWRQREIQFDAAFPQQSDTIVVVLDAATP